MSKNRHYIQATLQKKILIKLAKYLRLFFFYKCDAEFLVPGLQAAD